MKIFTSKSNFYFLGIFSIFLIWYISSSIADNSFIVPKISEVFLGLYNLLLNKQTYIIIFTTLSNLIFIIIISLLIGISLAMLSIMFKWFSYFIRPIISLFKTIPLASIIVILLILLDHQRSPLYITSLVVIPIIYEAIYFGMKAINNDILDDVKMISSLNFSVLFKVYLPLVYPFLITAIMQAFGLGFKVMIMAEYITQPHNTIGNIIYQEKLYLDNTAVFAWTLIVIILVFIVETIILYIKKRLDF